jgi:hypothetical protein
MYNLASLSWWWLKYSRNVDKYKNVIESANLPTLEGSWKTESRTTQFVLLNDVELSQKLPFLHKPGQTIYNMNYCTQASFWYHV